MTARRPVSLLLALLGLAAAGALALGCGLIGDDEDGAPPAVTVSSAAMGVALNESEQITRPQNVFPQGTQRIFASVVLKGAQVGMEVEGRWYQLSVKDAPPEGRQASAGGITLAEDNIRTDQARVALFQSAPSGFPVGDWLLRVYVDGTLVRTMGFIVLPDSAFGNGAPAEEEEEEEPPPPARTPTRVPTRTP